jgi:hypothetical protein
MLTFSSLRVGDLVRIERKFYSQEEKNKSLEMIAVFLSVDAILSEDVYKIRLIERDKIVSIVFCDLMDVIKKI